MNKEKQVRFRLEQDDWERLEKRAKEAKMSVSKYLRACVISEAGDLTITPKIQEDLKQYYGIISRLGSNVNQLTREINSEIKDVQDRLADASQVKGLMDHLDKVMADTQFVDPKQPKQLRLRLQRLFQRAQLSLREVNILRGICTAVLRKID